MSKALTWTKQFVRGKARKILVRAVVILLLVDVGFIFVMPLLRMLSQSLMNVMDFYDPTVVWIPRRWSWENYRLVFQALRYPLSFKNTTLLAAGAAVLQTIACAIVGYGFARFSFPGRDKIFALVLFAMIVPPHVIFIQLFILYKSLPAPARPGRQSQLAGHVPALLRTRGHGHGAARRIVCVHLPPVLQGHAVGTGGRRAD